MLMKGLQVVIICGLFAFFYWVLVQKFAIKLQKRVAFERHWAYNISRERFFCSRFPFLGIYNGGYTVPRLNLWVYAEPFLKTVNILGIYGVERF